MRHVCTLQLITTNKIKSLTGVNHVLPFRSVSLANIASLDAIFDMYKNSVFGKFFNS